MIENAIEEPIKVRYLHGYGSRFNPQSEKMRTLAQLGEVVGPDLDYGEGPDAVCQVARDFAYEEAPELIVGTSMGGCLASLASQLETMHTLWFHAGLNYGAEDYD